MCQSQGKTPNRKNNIILLNKQSGYVIISPRFELACKVAAYSGVVLMLILIDGYNLIRQSDILRNYERQSLEAGRRALISKLIEYEKKKGHKITVVFDGGKNGSADEGSDQSRKN